MALLYKEAPVCPMPAEAERALLSIRTGLNASPEGFSKVNFPLSQTSDNPKNYISLGQYSFHWSKVNLWHRISCFANLQLHQEYCLSFKNCLQWDSWFRRYIFSFIIHWNERTVCACPMSWTAGTPRNCCVTDQSYTACQVTGTKFFSGFTLKSWHWTSFLYGQAKNRVLCKDIWYDPNLTNQLFSCLCSVDNSCSMKWSNSSSPATCIYIVEQLPS